MTLQYVLSRFHSTYGNRFWFLVEESDLPQGVRMVQVTGSFNHWKPSEYWSLKYENPRRWILDLPLGRVEAPGNSGYPEYQFLLDGSTILGAEHFPEEPRIGNNFLIVPHAEAQSWQQRVRELTTSRPMEGDSRQWLANFWEVGGGNLAPGRLFRSSHPFLPALADERDRTRLQAVVELWNQHHIANVINLSDGEGVIFDPACPKAYALAGRDGRVLFLPLEYGLVYYHSRGNLFQSSIGKILAFLARTKGPWVLHCRLGIDRTGVVAAILQALAAAPWDRITADFSRTAVFSPYEFRHPDLLAYTFRRLLGKDPREVSDLAQETRNSLARSVPNQEILDQALQNLTRTA